MSKSNKAVVESTVTTDVVTEPTTVETKVVKTKVELGQMTAEDLINHFGSISKAIRGLNDAGFDRGAIAKSLNKRYQHVRNVLITPLTKVAA